ncbi:MAG: A/G-specific adenine glycosylase [Proteobacteria bacterium]|nr:A/G-specific adenine glycosylase [Pseudomonadota bacterium]
MLNNLTDFHSRILSWYHQNKRDLPWRKTADPYCIWISEIMLQQTQVRTVIPYYNRFLKRFPTIEKLSQATLDDVLKQWEGLGYYSRARNLHVAAQTLAEKNLGQFPDNRNELRKLPGIGDYTSAAIMSIAFNQAVPAVDGNIKRVFARLASLDDPVNATTSNKTFNRMASQIMYHEDPGSYNQALMELGALVCKPQNPDCTKCPVSSHCTAFQNGTVEQFPQVKKRPKTPEYHIAVGVVIKDKKLLITRRAEKGLLGGLWEFPGGKLENNEEPNKACIREIKEETGLDVTTVEHLATVKHAYSHFKIKMDVFICDFVSGEVELSGPTDHRWIAPELIDKYAFPKANHKFISKLKNWQGLAS